MSTAISVRKALVGWAVEDTPRASRPSRTADASGDLTARLGRNPTVLFADVCGETAYLMRDRDHR